MKKPVDFIDKDEKQNIPDDENLKNVDDLANLDGITPTPDKADQP